MCMVFNKVPQLQHTWTECFLLSLLDFCLLLCKHVPQQRRHTCCLLFSMPQLDCTRPARASPCAA